MTSALSLCAQEIQKTDHDQFLCGLYASDDTRDAFYALQLFAIETTRIRDMVNEPQLGHMRIQWWRDLIDGVYADQEAHSENGTHREFIEAIRPKKIDKALFERYLNARSFDLEDQAHDDLPALMRYLEATGGSIAQMKANVLGADNLETAARIGTAQGLCDLMKTLPYQARTGRCKIPKSLLKKHDFTLKDFMDFKPNPAINACVKELASEVQKLITQARTDKAPSNAVLLSTIAMEDYLKRLNKVDYDPFNPNIGGGRLSRQLKLMFKAWRGSY
ncbi:squalene/phytoene synthase family protein [Terasakiella sp. A23]|uniref:squalene/phytoene synthase family protein n=1 Tax=Terasakiella sp. FCG-A23 TaxID=3080561 RepID=UPI002955C532|nr:squalene/phytoene synthase family protein [Terasakiella sp. A23]MDV7338784.1 squalene/phytoene synthase family protein [Terasakiella sp. A23]